MSQEVLLAITGSYSLNNIVAYEYLYLHESLDRAYGRDGFAVFTVYERFTSAFLYGAGIGAGGGYADWFNRC